MMKNYIFVSIS